MASRPSVSEIVLGTAFDDVFGHNRASKLKQFREIFRKPIKLDDLQKRRRFDPYVSIGEECVDHAAAKWIRAIKSPKYRNYLDGLSSWHRINKMNEDFSNFTDLMIANPNFTCNCIPSLMDDWDQLQSYANQGHLFVGLQEVPQSVWNAQNEDCACLYNTFHNMIQAVVLPEGIALINTHRSPNMNRGAAKTYWATMRCSVSRLLHGGKDKDNRHFDAVKCLVIVGDLNASIENKLFGNDRYLKNLIAEFDLLPVNLENTYFGKDGVVARYDYILHTKNIVWRRELEEFDNLSSDHKVIASEFPLVDIEIKQAPFGEHKDLDWQEFKNVIYATFAKF
uniref:Endonuclease/exonuclease/phosphatase domain-containing protein n=1 Tax=Tetranychus urticae TaxID=32264 RepID=T1KDI3_TETUR